MMCSEANSSVADPCRETEYGQNLAAVNAALSKYLNITISNREAVQMAQRKLVERQTADPQPEPIVISQEDKTRYPWLDPLLNKKLKHRCPDWNQFATDLYYSPTYRRWLCSQVNNYMKPPVKADRNLSKEERVTIEFAYVLSDIHEILTGRVAAYLLMATAKKDAPELMATAKKDDPEKTWLDWGLYENNDVPRRKIMLERGEVQRRSNKPKTNESESDATATAKKPRAKVKTNTDLYGDELPPEADAFVPSPDEDAELNELAEQLRRVRTGLNSRQQAVLELVVDQEMTQEEAARQLGLSVNQVRYAHELAIETMKSRVAKN